jgi:hypothetical protein
MNCISKCGVICAVEIKIQHRFNSSRNYPLLLFSFYLGVGKYLAINFCDIIVLHNRDLHTI